MQRQCQSQVWTHIHKQWLFIHLDSHSRNQCVKQAKHTLNYVVNKKMTSLKKRSYFNFFKIFFIRNILSYLMFSLLHNFMHIAHTFNVFNMHLQWRENEDKKKPLHEKACLNFSLDSHLTIFTCHVWLQDKIQQTNCHETHTWSLVLPSLSLMWVVTIRSVSSLSLG